MSRDGVRAGLLPDGKRLHLQHGPIDLIVEAFGDPAEIHAAYVQAASGFVDVLPTLVKELPVLRSPLKDVRPLPAGPVSQRMVAACWPHRESFITPMAAVAGSVADHMLQALLDGRRLERAYVNDGGDIAFHLTAGQSLTCGLVADLAAPGIDGTISLTHALPVRGLATSGRATRGQGGRSFSLGIADAVTVLARDAASADAAATMIANAVDLPGHKAITREPASAHDPDSDLGDRPVTLDVGALSDDDIAEALRAGVARAESMRRSGLIHGAVLVLKRRLATVGADLPLLAAA